MAWGQPQAFGGSPDYGASASANAANVAEAARVFMNRVYGWMFVGLGLTGAIAWGVAAKVAADEAFARSLMGLFVPLLIGEFVLVLALSWLAPRVSGAVAGTLFLIYAAVSGVTLSVIFLVYPIGTISQAFLLTAGVFGAMSLYATVTKKDLGAWGAFLFMGLIGIILAGVINMFVRNSMADFVIACATVVVFAGLTAYDTQKLRRYHASMGYSSAMSLSIAGALTLYLDFINLFLAILRLLGRRR